MALAALTLSGILPALGAAGLEWLLSPLPEWLRAVVLVPLVLASFAAFALMAVLA